MRREATFTDALVSALGLPPIYPYWVIGESSVQTMSGSNVGRGRRAH